MVDRVSNAMSSRFSFLLSFLSENENLSPCRLDHSLYLHNPYTISITLPYCLIGVHTVTQLLSPCNIWTAITVIILWWLCLEGSFHQSSSCGTIWSHAHRGNFHVLIAQIGLIHLIKPGHCNITRKSIRRFSPCLINNNPQIPIYPFNLQAAAYGLPVVATKNGGPVDISKVMVFHVSHTKTLNLFLFLSFFQELTFRLLQSMYHSQFTNIQL